MQNVMLILMGIMTVAIVFSGYRALIGPGVADRVMALEMIAALLVGLLALGAMWTGTAAMLDAAVVLAVVSFIGAVAMARFMERKAAERG